MYGISFIRISRYYVVVVNHNIKQVSLIVSRFHINRHDIYMYVSSSLLSMCASHTFIENNIYIYIYIHS